MLKKIKHTHTHTKRLQITSAGEDMEKREPSYTVGGNVNWMQPLWKTVWRVLKKLKIEPPYNPAFPLLGIYKENENTNLKRYMHLNVHCSIIYNSQDMEVT